MFILSCWIFYLGVLLAVGSFSSVNKCHFSGKRGVKEKFFSPASQQFHRLGGEHYKLEQPQAVFVRMDTASFILLWASFSLTWGRRHLMPPLPAPGHKITQTFRKGESKIQELALTSEVILNCSSPSNTQRIGNWVAIAPWSRTRDDYPS